MLSFLVLSADYAHFDEFLNWWKTKGSKRKKGSIAEKIAARKKAEQEAAKQEEEDLAREKEERAARAKEQAEARKKKKAAAARKRALKKLKRMAR